MRDRFLGIDFANKRSHLGQCLIELRARLLSVAVPDADVSPRECEKTAVDCPFGTTTGFLQVLRGEPLERDRRFLKYRSTEERIVDEIKTYQTLSDWQVLKTGIPYFNSGGHVQPTVGMVIVPECVLWIQDTFAGSAKPELRLQALERARLGGDEVVEAHPRMFLYSAIELSRRRSGRPVESIVLRAAAHYKKKGADGEQHREVLLDSLARLDWLGDGNYSIEMDAATKSRLIAVDHAFDAWLCALTALASRDGLTKPWREFNLDEVIVRTEGHMHLLRLS